MNTVHGGIYTQDPANRNPAAAPVPDPLAGARVLQEHRLAERQIELERTRRAELARRLVEEQRRRREEALVAQRLLEAQERRRREDAQQHVQRWQEARERRRQEEERLAAEVARREAVKKQEGSWCAIM